MDENNPKLKHSLLELLGSVPDLVRDLVRAEFEAFKAQMIEKGKAFAVAAVLFVLALMVLFWVIAVLIESAVFAFALVLPAWAAALVVAAILLLIILVLVVIAVARLKAGSAEETVKESIQQDIDVVKGEGRYE